MSARVGARLGLLSMLILMTALPALAQARLDAPHWSAVAVQNVVSWAETHHTLALLALGAADAAAVVLMLPAFLLAVGAGFLFGVLVGSLLIVVSTLIGAAVAHALGRRLLRAWTLRWLARHPRLARLGGALVAGGWRSILLLRLVPFLPFKTCNYLLGALRVPRGHFVLGTALGILPMTVVTVSAGALTGDLLSLRGAQPSGVANASLFVLAAIAAALLAWQARRALARDSEGPGPRT